MYLILFVKIMELRVQGGVLSPLLPSAKLLTAAVLMKMCILLKLSNVVYFNDCQF